METTIVTLLWMTLLATTAPTIDNTTDAHPKQNVSESGVWSPLSQFYVSSSLRLAFKICNFVIAVIGSLANGYVLLALLLSKSSHKSCVNVFIAHQTLLDLTASIFLFITHMANTVRVRMTRAICLMFDSYTISITASNAGICGLVIITIERYFKIVHPVAHRNKYRSWMTRAGIIVPWIFGLCTEFVPTVATTGIVYGACIREILWPNGAPKVTWGVVKFLLLYAMPLACFVFAYWKILGVIRRQRKQIGQQAGTSTSNVEMVAQKNRRRAEMNVIKTMVLVSVTFTLCFFCMKAYALLITLKLVPVVRSIFGLFSVFQYSSQCFNPFIYASQYDVVRHWWRAKVCRVFRGQHEAHASSIRDPARGPDPGKLVQTTRNL